MFIFKYIRNNILDKKKKWLNFFLFITLLFIFSWFLAIFSGIYIYYNLKKDKILARNFKIILLKLKNKKKELLKNKFKNNISLFKSLEEIYTLKDKNIIFIEGRTFNLNEKLIKLFLKYKEKKHKYNKIKLNIIFKDDKCDKNNILEKYAVYLEELKKDKFIEKYKLLEEDENKYSYIIYLTNKKINCIIPNYIKNKYRQKIQNNEITLIRRKRYYNLTISIPIDYEINYYCGYEFYFSHDLNKIIKKVLYPKAAKEQEDNQSIHILYLNIKENNNPLSLFWSLFLSLFKNKQKGNLYSKIILFLKKNNIEFITGREDIIQNFDNFINSMEKIMIILEFITLLLVIILSIKTYLNILYNDKRSIGILKAYGISNFLIIMVYTLQFIFIFLISLILSFLVIFLLFYILKNKIMLWSSINFSVLFIFNILFDIIKINILIILLPLILILLISFKKIRFKSPSEYFLC